MLYKNNKRKGGRVTPDGLPKYRRWTLTSVECYLRGCRCGEYKDKEKCILFPYCSEKGVDFVLKQVVLKLVREIGIHRILTDLQSANENGKECKYGNSGSS